MVAALRNGFAPGLFLLIDLAKSSDAQSAQGKEAERPRWIVCVNKFVQHSFMDRLTRETDNSVFNPFGDSSH